MRRLLTISFVVAAVSLQSKAPKAIINRGQQNQVLQHPPRHHDEI